MSSTRPEVDFDHHSPEYATSSDEINADLVARCPVAWSDHYDGFWVVSKYADVATVSRDDDTYSSDHDTTGDGNGTGGIAIPPPPVRNVPIEMDPPEFHDYRKLLNPYFSPRMANVWRPYVEALAEECLDAISEQGSGDLLRDLTSPLPAKFTLALMGLDLDDWKAYSDPAHNQVAVPSTDERYGEVMVETLGLVNRLYEEVVARRAAPRDDMISYLCECTVDGEVLTDQRVTEICSLLIFGGVDTTTGLAANALIWLEQNPAQRTRLLEEPALMSTAVEEWLRYYTPVQTIARTVMKDVELGGQCIAQGDRLLMNFAAANRDPDQFEDPQLLDPERKPNRHAAFGLGIHRCLGSNYARLMIDVMVSAVLRRIPDYVVDLDSSVRYQTIGQVNGWDSVPITFTPTASTGTKLPDPPAFDPRR